MWPFRRKNKKKRGSAKPQHTGNPHARRRKKELEERRRRGTRQKQRGHGPPPSTEEEIQPWHRAPPGPAVWQWIKRAPADYFVSAWNEPNPYGFEDFRRWPTDPAPRMARAIRRHVLELILEAGRSQWPQEFAGLLRAEDGIIEELILLPGTISGDTHAIFQFHMMPSDPSIIGTIHSHPNPIPFPSAADTELFRSHGRVHIIACHPFRRGDWNAFNERSYKIPIEIID
jgi:proteasome lid subunit RPN8/RPN11